jgi:hypothetical protein
MHVEPGVANGAKIVPVDPAALSLAKCQGFHGTASSPRRACIAPDRTKRECGRERSRLS